MKKYNSNTLEVFSSKEMEDMGKNLAPETSVGTVIGLKGELGSGKTTFTKGFAKGLGIKAHVTSPTFKIVSEYDGDGCTLFHIDCYRLSDHIEFINMDAERFIYSENGITLIEWIEKIEAIMPKKYPVIQFQLGDESETHRTITLTGFSE